MPPRLKGNGVISAHCKLNLLAQGVVLPHPFDSNPDPRPPAPQHLANFFFKRTSHLSLTKSSDYRLEPLPSPYTCIHTYIYFRNRVSALSPRLEYSGRIMAHCSLDLLSSSNPPI